MLAPNARRVATVMQFSDRTQIDHAVFADISKGVAGLISGVPEIGHFHFCCHGVSLQLDPAQFTRITRLDYGYRPGQDYFANIVCQSSSILKYLSILNPSAAHLEQILYGTDSSIAYPSLEELSLSGTTESVEVRFEAEFVHFPSLRKLFVHGLYPFARSVLAKGDNVTLEQLGVSFQFLASGPSNTNNLGLLTTLLSSRFVNLQAFFGSLVYNPSDLETFIDESYDNTVQTFINSLHCYKSLRKLEFSGSYFSHAIPNGVLSYKGLDSLRILKIESIEVVISDVALILRKAPLLESLRCHLTHRRSIVYSLGTDQLRKYIETDIVSLKSKLVAVKITNTNEMNCTQIAKFLILLGIACPLLSSVVTMTIGYDVLRTKISSLLTTSPFDEYAEKCSRLATIVSK
ncbi:hypothetical protein IW150_001778 [Coemansia sp. RSA 2607]|nr:hypothetical protein IW150_001778 [Coemansia sp. RSA 2607]